LRLKARSIAGLDQQMAAIGLVPLAAAGHNGVVLSLPGEVMQLNLTGLVYGAGYTDGVVNKFRVGHW